MKVLLIAVVFFGALFYFWVHLDEQSRHRREVVESMNTEENQPFYFHAEGLRSDVLVIQSVEPAGNVEDDAVLDGLVQDSEAVADLQSEGFTEIRSGSAVRRLK